MLFRAEKDNEKVYYEPVPDDVELDIPEGTFVATATAFAPPPLLIASFFVSFVGLFLFFFFFLLFVLFAWLSRDQMSY